MELVAVLSAAQRERAAALAAEIWREHYAALLPAGQIDYMLERFQSAEAIRRQIEEEGVSYVLIREGEALCGYFAYVRRDSPRGAGRGLFLSKLYLRRAWRGRGLAARAVLFLQQLGLSEGIDYLWLTVNRNNAGSIAFYERMGFVKWNEERADIGGGYAMDDFILKFEIRPETVPRRPCRCSAGRE